MRVSVVGGGLVGSLLAWRLAQRPGVRVNLFAPPGDRDATGASGGLVRGFETDPVNAASAAASLAELSASRVLAGWASFRVVGSVYVCATAPDPGLVASVDTALPGSLTVLEPAQITARSGLTGLPATCVGVSERLAGHIAPGRLARSVRGDLRARGGVVQEASVRRVRLLPGGDVGCRMATRWEVADVVVVAAGAWTAELLAASGLPAADLRTKRIQYAVWAAAGSPPPPFVDETTGLYGRPDGPGRMLLGLPTSDWDVAAGGRRFHRAEEQDVRRWAAQRLPGLSLGKTLRRVAAVDGYSPDSRLALRHVPADGARLFTFAGGSGGAAKTALAASARAAAELLGEVPAPVRRAPGPGSTVTASEGKPA